MVAWVCSLSDVLAHDVRLLVVSHVCLVWLPTVHIVCFRICFACLFLLAVRLLPEFVALLLLLFCSFAASLWFRISWMLKCLGAWSLILVRTHSTIICFAFCRYVFAQRAAWHVYNAGRELLPNSPEDLAVDDNNAFQLRFMHPLVPYNRNQRWCIQHQTLLNYKRNYRAVLTWIGPAIDHGWFGAPYILDNLQINYKDTGVPTLVPFPWLAPQRSDVWFRDEPDFSVLDWLDECLKVHGSVLDVIASTAQNGGLRQFSCDGKNGGLSAPIASMFREDHLPGEGKIYISLPQSA